MQAVDVLRDQGELWTFPLQLNECKMTRVRLSFRNQAAAPIIPAPNEVGIACKRAGRAKILGAKLVPEAGRSTERRHATLGGNTRARQDRESRAALQPSSRLFQRVVP